MSDALGAPLTFTPLYKVLVWGGRRLEAWRPDLPPGPVGESWDVADHDSGRSVVEAGPLAGATLGELAARFGRALVGDGFAGGPFPLLVKTIDASARLSVQVHPDDAIARRLGRGDNGKSECWSFLAGGGEVFHGTRPGVDRLAFERVLAEGRVAEALNRFEAEAGDFFYLPARTVHALGAGCLVCEIQQTSDVTLRVYDWGRVGLDGRPRPLHVAESLATIDFDGSGFGPRRPAWRPHAAGGERRPLVEGPYFAVEEWRGAGTRIAAAPRCTLVTCLEGTIEIETAGGRARLGPTRTALLPAAAGGASIAAAAEARALLSEPRFG
jgi:mannose-6-phosphate isomerase